MKNVFNKLITFSFLIAILFSFSSCGFGVAWVWGGIRFTPDDAIEAVGLGLSRNEKIQTKDYTFYIDAFQTDDDWIEYVYPVEQTDIGMYHAITRLGKYSSAVYIGEDLIRVGRLITMEGENCFYHFCLCCLPSAQPFAVC